MHSKKIYKIIYKQCNNARFETVLDVFTDLGMELREDAQMKFRKQTVEVKCGS